MAEARTRRGLQHDAAINRRYTLNIFGEPQGAGQVIARRFIKAED
jgi:hypothetical protein